MTHSSYWVRNADAVLTSINKSAMVQIGDEAVQIRRVTRKLIDDIRFLEERLEQMRGAKSPSTQMKKHYQQMLDSRESVMLWFHANHLINVDLDEDSIMGQKLSDKILQKRQGPSVAAV